MDPTAGFASVMAVSALALNALARVMHRAGRTPRRLNAATPAFGTLPGVTFADLLLDAPTVVLAPSNQGKLGLRLSGWGPVIVAPPGGPTETRDATLAVEIHVAIRAVLVNGKLGIRIDPVTATIATLQVRPFVGTSFAVGNQAYLDSAGFRTLLELGLQALLAPNLFPPFDVSFLGPLASDPSSKATIAVVDGALALGIDTSIGSTTTVGDKTLLANILEGNDLAVWTNPVALPVLFASVRQGLQATVTAQGGTLDTFDMVIQPGGFALSGSASQSAGSVGFSMVVSPHIGQQGDPARRQLTFSIGDVVISVNPAWWVVLLEVVFPPLIAVVQLFVQMVRSNIVNALPGYRDGGAVTQRFTLEGIEEPVVRTNLVAFDCRTEGVFVGMRMEVDFHGSRLTGPAAVDADAVPFLGGNKLTYRVDLGFDGVPEDRQLRVRWTVRTPGAPSPTYIVDQASGPSGTVLTFQFDQLDVPLLAAPVWEVACRLYRVFGAEVVEVRNHSTLLRVADRLDRTRPYVRWRHQVLVPNVRVEPDSTHTILGSVVKTRRSKIHRTALPGRCRMAAGYSQSWIEPVPQGQTGPSLEYLDLLPFPTADLPAHRAQVCDYCFFGGPTRTSPLVT